ncbi:MAG: glycosyltransferase [bacterium]
MGGAEMQLLRVLPWLARSGYENSVCGLKGPGPMTPKFESLGIQASWLGGKGKWDFRVLFRLYRELRRLRPSILHCYTTLANWAGAAAGRAAGVPLIVMSDRDIRTWLRPWQVMVDRCAFKLGTCMTMPSEAIKRFNIERLGHPPRRLVVVPNGISVAQGGSVGENQRGLEKGFRKRDIALIGYVGRITEPLKGLAILLQSLSLLKGFGLQYKALVVGDGRDRKRMEELSHQLGLEEKVAFLGERNDVPDLMQELDLLVIPSLCEGSPNVALEAMAMGVPVVATHVGGTPELLKDGITGWLVPPGDPVALAKTMAWVLKEPTQAMEVACRARTWVVHHRSAEAAGAAVARLYDFLLAKMQKRKNYLREMHPQG